MAFIEVVIKIPEGDYKFIKETAEKEPSNLNYIARKILTGTVLPKGHGRLKDVDALYDRAKLCHTEEDGTACVEWREINDATPIIEADKEED